MQCVLVPCHFGVFTFSPSSTRRRMASERETSFAAAHASSAATVCGSSLAGIVSLNFVPGGRPILFLCTVLSCFAMSICVHERQAEGKRQLPPRL
jgi:hypothetical protein